MTARAVVAILLALASLLLLLAAFRARRARRPITRLCVASVLCSSAAGVVGLS